MRLLYYSFPYKKTFRLNMSDLSADYQGALSGESWQRTMNPKSDKISLEMKANYDSLMFSRTKFIDVEKTIPELKSLGRDKIDSFKKQAGRHNLICSAHPYAHCCWVFMTPLAYNAFLDILEVNSYPALSAIWVPLP